MLKTLFRSFIPWVIFFVFLGYDLFELKIGATGALIALVLLSKQGLKRGFLFDWSSLLFFIFICATIYIFYQPWVDTNASLLANIVLTCIAWLSLLAGRPFTFQYAKQSVTKEYWQTKLFKRINYHLTVIWALCFTLMTACSVAGLYGIGNRDWMTEILPLTLIVMTLWISLWYPEWIRNSKIGKGGVVTIAGMSDLHTVETMSAKVTYRSLGHGSVMVLLPAANMSMYGWDPELLERLSKRHQLILIDYPGIGASKSQVGDILNVNGLARILPEFISELGLRSIVVVGFGMGGWVAQQMAIDYGKHLHGLVLLGTDAGGSRAAPPDVEKSKLMNDDTGTLEEQSDRLSEVLFPASVRPQMLDKMRNLFKSAGMVRNIPNETILAEEQLSQNWYSSEGTYNQLSQIKQATLILTGIQDTVTHRQNSLVLVNGIYNAKLIEYPDAGHGVMYQHPAEIADAVVEYFKGRD